MEVASPDVALLAEQIIKHISTRTGEVRVAPRLLSVEQAAAYLSRSEPAVQKLISRGVIPVTMIDGKRQIDRHKLDKLIEDKTYFQ